jgi:hypothetical protein
MAGSESTGLPDRGAAAGALAAEAGAIGPSVGYVMVACWAAAACSAGLSA